METSPTAHKLTGRFIAGLTLDDELRVIRRIQAAGMMASMDYLGENVKTLDEAGVSRDAYLAALDSIAAERLPATVSMKLTSLGLDISEDACVNNADVLVRRAQETATRVECDMESSEYADRTLSIVTEMHKRRPGSVRAVIQAYLYRSERDIERLNELGVPVRLCKGAYREPSNIAWPAKADVDRNYAKLMELLLDGGTYPALATHDEAMIGNALAYVRRRGYDSDRFEFQMLYGVRRDLQKRIAGQGYRLRLYVPYGTAWYPYFMRRLAERPANALFIARNLLRG